MKFITFITIDQTHIKKQISKRHPFARIHAFHILANAASTAARGTFINDNCDRDNYDPRCSMSFLLAFAVEMFGHVFISRCEIRGRPMTSAPASHYILPPIFSNFPSLQISSIAYSFSTQLSVRHLSKKLPVDLIPLHR